MKTALFSLAAAGLIFLAASSDAQDKAPVNGVATGKKPAAANAKGVVCDEFGEFSDGLCAVKKGDKWGFIDTLGNLVIDYTFPFSHFSYSYPIFRNGLCMIPGNLNGKMIVRYIDKKGKEVISNPTFLKGSEFVDGYANVSTTGDKIMMINTKGLQVFPALSYTGTWANPENPGKFSEGLAPYLDYKKRLFGFIDSKGTIVVPAQFNEVSGFSEGLAAVNKTTTTGERMWGFIDKKGAVVIDFIFTNKPGNFSEGLAVVKAKDEKFGYIDPKGNVVIQPKYANAFLFKNGSAIVVEWMQQFPVVIDRQGNKKGDVPVKQFNLESEFVNGMATYTEGFGYSAGAITPDGQLILPHYIADKMNYKYMGPFHNGLSRAAAPIDGKMVDGFINASGDFVIIKAVSQF